MSPGHDWAAKNSSDLLKLKGLIWRRAFHISPDKGSAIYGFDSMENLEKGLPHIKKGLNDYCKMFEAKLSIEKGITSPDLCQDIK